MSKAPFSILIQRHNSSVYFPSPIVNFLPLYQKANAFNIIDKSLRVVPDGCIRKENMVSIKILGSGSADCIKLEETVVKTAKKLGLEYALEKVTSINSILSYGVVLSPGLVIDEEVKSVGVIPSMEDMKKLLTEPPISERAMVEGFKREKNTQQNSSLPL